MGIIIDGLRDLWCEYTHGGGHVLRDPSGSINWQCAKCRRWKPGPIRDSFYYHANQWDRDKRALAAKPEKPDA